MCERRVRLDSDEEEEEEEEVTLWSGQGRETYKIG